MVSGEHIPRRYLIEFQSKSSASLLESLKNNQDIHIRYSYTHSLFQGASIEINHADREHKILKDMLSHPDITFITPNRRIKANDVTISKSQKLSPEDIKRILPHELHQVDKVRKDLNLTGEGIFVGIVDTGIDYRLPALGGGFGPNYKVIAGSDFVGHDDSVPSLSFRNDSNPIDLCAKETGSVGHGTHVAGTIAGYDPANNFEGVAPNAKLGMWRALGCDGAGSDESVMNGALAAFDAGVNILSLSLGSLQPWTDPDIPSFKVFDRMAKSGIFVVIAAANDGRNGAFTVGSLSSSTFSVAATVNKYAPNPLEIHATGVAGPIHGTPLMNGTETTYIDGDLYVSPIDKEGIWYDFCSDEPLSDSIEGEIVYIYKDAGCSLERRLARIKKLGAVGVITYNSSDRQRPSSDLDGKSLPVVLIPYSSAKALYYAYLKNDGKVSINFSQPRDGLSTDRHERTVSEFSSVGPTADLNFSPNIAATGENVYSTIPSQLGGYGFMSGTSMATPYVSGALALYLEYHGDNKTNPDVVRAKFENYASITSLHNITSGIVENPLRQGTGLIQVYDAIIQTVHVLPSSVSFKDSSFVSEKTQTLTITNDGTDAVSYKIYNNVSVAIAPYNRTRSGYNYTRPSGNVYANAAINFSATEIRVNPGESQSISVTIVPPETNPLDHIMYGGYIQFNPVIEEGRTHKPIHIPYFGIVGSQRDLSILDPSSFRFTYRGSKHDYSYIGQEQHPPRIVHTFDTRANETEQFIDITYRTLSPTKIIATEIIDYYTQQTAGILGLQRYTGQSENTFSVSFDGYYCTDIACDNPIQNGTYVIRITALKLFGDENNENDYEKWTSIPFTINTI